MSESGVADNEDLLLSTTGKLRLRSLLLYRSRFDRPVEIPDGFEGRLEQQYRHGVQARLGSEIAEGVETKLMLATVTLGTRLVGEAGDGEPPVHVVIEADFQVEYELQDGLAEDALKAFVNFNVVHNVWPFWRQHVFDIVQRGGLPPLEIPLFAGAKL